MTWLSDDSTGPHSASHMFRSVRRRVRSGGDSPGARPTELRCPREGQEQQQRKMTSNNKEAEQKRKEEYQNRTKTAVRESNKEEEQKAKRWKKLEKRRNWKSNTENEEGQKQKRRINRSSSPLSRIRVLYSYSSKSSLLSAKMTQSVLFENTKLHRVVSGCPESDRSQPT